jgi:hypothetical protein
MNDLLRWAGKKEHSVYQSSCFTAEELYAIWNKVSLLTKLPKGGTRCKKFN